MTISITGHQLPILNRMCTNLTLQQFILKKIISLSNKKIVKIQQL